jgi:hypothetical protein
VLKNRPLAASLMQRLFQTVLTKHQRQKKSKSTERVSYLLKGVYLPVLLADDSSPGLETTSVGNCALHQRLADCEKVQSSKGSGQYALASPTRWVLFALWGQRTHQPTGVLQAPHDSFRPCQREKELPLKVIWQIGLNYFWSSQEWSTISLQSSHIQLHWCISQYNDLDRLTRITQTGNGVTTKRVDMAYNRASQLIGIDRFSDLNGTQLVAESDYFYDSLGRLIQLKHQNANTIFADY